MLGKGKAETVELTKIEAAIDTLLKAKLYGGSHSDHLHIIDALTTLVIDQNKELIPIIAMKKRKQEKASLKAQLEAKKDLAKKMKANIARFKKLLICMVDGVDCRWNETVIYRYEGYGETENIKVTPKDLCENILNNLVSQPDSRTERDAFDRSIFSHYRECRFAKYVIGKKGGHGFKIMLHWKP